jgi:hypothetical protein
MAEAMSSFSNKPTEERLQEIKAAAEQAHARAGRHKPPQIEGHESYYGLPALKPPVWTWEVPLYFFLGGVTGMSACLALAAEIFHREASLIRALLWMALIGSAICPALLIADLGRPLRFLNMLRVFKPQSTMSMGAWILVAFSNCAFVAVLANELFLHGYTNPVFLWLRRAGELAGAITGLLLASYTGVLLGATAIPIWVRHRHLLPGHFLTSGLGASSAILELLGFLTPTTQWLGIAASAIETTLGTYFELPKRRGTEPLHHGQSGVAFRLAGPLEGPIALVVRLVWGASPAGRYAAAISFLLGSLLTRYAWIWAGRASAKDTKTLFEMQRSAD